MSVGRCVFCDLEVGHLPVCPMTFILANPDRRLAFTKGSGVATSDWVEAAGLSPASPHFGPVVDGYVALTRYHDRRHAAELDDLSAMSSAQLMAWAADRRRRRA